MESLNLVPKINISYNKSKHKFGSNKFNDMSDTLRNNKIERNIKLEERKSRLDEVHDRIKLNRDRI